MQLTLSAETAVGTERTAHNRVVVIKSWRKHGNGAKGGGRQGSTGKKGQIFQVATDGTRTALKLSKDADTLTGATFADLSRKLRGTGLIPRHVALNSRGDTHF